MLRKIAAVLAVAFVVAAPARAALDGDDAAPRLIDSRMLKELHSRASLLGTSASVTDTTFVGYTPGAPGAGGANYWSIYAGTGKDGYYRLRNGQPHKGVWDWEEAVQGDSLQGWWPLRTIYATTGGTTLPDRNRPWWAIDIGNQANYRINQANGRTFGVSGVWHRDGGSLVPGPVLSPLWTPPSGSYAAWMGLRAHGDATHLDPVTGNAFNEDALVFTGFNASSVSGNDAGFPGYGSQMDQMLYRDIDLTGNTSANLTIRFKFQTVMSTGFGTTQSTRTGWFDCCPLGVTAGATLPANQRNNFISSTDATNAFAPRDSFMIYIGRGVQTSDTWADPTGASHAVYDPQRRWFGEVLKWDRDPGSNPASPQPLYYKEILSVAGDRPAAGGFVDTTFVIPNAVLAPLLGDSARVRLVFRVKTNRGFDDQGTVYSSGRKGAAVIDRVAYSIGGGAEVVFGDFEGASDLDNRLEVSPLAAWKSTGKPPAILDHLHLFSDLRYEDLCGQKGDLSRICNMSGVVISSGDHDHGEAAGGLVAGTAEREVNVGIMSPAICFADDDGNPNTKNVHGLYGRGGNGGVGDIEPTDDYYIAYEIYTGSMDLGTQGNGWVFACMSYPANAKSGYGYPAWGAMRFPGIGPLFTSTRECFPDLEPLRLFNLVRTSNASGIPDSLRIFLRRAQQCFRFGVSTGCSPTDGTYWDNISLAIVDGPVSQLSTNIWDWYQDTFPANETAGLPGVAALFDTTAALIKNGYNLAQSTNNTLRHCVPGDSVGIYSSAATARVDMVFRILPGPGNYEPIGRPDLGTLRRVPSSLATVTKGDGSFWDEYRQTPGDFGSPDAVLLHHNAAGGWDPNVWNSARCDTMERNLAELEGRGVFSQFGTGTWMSTLHESDPHFNTLGIRKNVCYVRCLACLNTDIRCDGGQPTDYVIATGPGGTPGTTTTKEFTKVIPDGLLTPGSHVEYFFRDQKDGVAPGDPGELLPDTNLVFPQVAEGSADGHRWQQFGVLPNRWKDPAYRHPVTREFGSGPACLLVVDHNDRGGNERVWVSIADTIGATPQRYWGAHNGWHAVGGGDVNAAADNRRGSDGQPGFVVEHLGQPGSGGTWDMYQVKAAENAFIAAGTIGSRLAHRGGGALEADKTSRQGPTLEMLNAYYSMVLFLSGDLNSGLLGPSNNRSQNDVGILSSWLQAGSTSAPNRALWAMGDGFVQSSAATAAGSVQNQFLANFLGVALLSPNYSILTANTEELVRLRVLSGWNGDPFEHLYGVRNICSWSNDALTRDGIGLALGTVTAQYERRAGGFTAGASVYKAWDSTSPWITLVDGWDLAHLTSEGDANATGRAGYFLRTFTSAFAALCDVAGTPLVPLDVPKIAGSAGFSNFMRLFNNPVLRGGAIVRFGVARADRVEARIYDVSGRLVRTLSDRMFAAGEHALTWDGLDDQGHRRSRGVYFARLRYASSGFEDAKKVVVLRD